MAELLADLPPDVAKRSELLIEADRLFMAGGYRRGRSGLSPGQRF